MNYSFTTQVWRYPGDAAWYFASLPAEYTDELKVISNSSRRGFGSIKVEATVGDTKWNTSIFPDNKSGCFMLPIKKEVRLKNHLEDGNRVQIAIELKENF